MRIHVVGNNETASMLRGLMLRDLSTKAAIADSPDKPEISAGVPKLLIYIEETATDDLVIDGVDSELERLIISNIAELTPQRIILQRVGGIQSDLEIRLVVPVKLKDPVALGIFRGILSFFSQPTKDNQVFTREAEISDEARYNRAARAVEHMLQLHAAHQEALTSQKTELERQAEEFKTAREALSTWQTQHALESSVDLEHLTLEVASLKNTLAVAAQALVDNQKKADERFAEFVDFITTSLKTRKGFWKKLIGVFALPLIFCGGLLGQPAYTQDVNIKRIGGTATSAGQINVNCVAGCTAAAAFADNAAFTAGTTPINISGGVFNEGLSDVTSGSAAAPRITAKRGLHVNLRNNSGTEITTWAVTQSGTWNVGLLAGTNLVGKFTIQQGGNDATVSAAGALKVDGSAVTQPVSGTVTATATDLDIRDLVQTQDAVTVYGSDDGGTTKRIVKTDAGGAVQVDVESSALPTGAATLAEQQTQTASLSVLDDWDETNRAAVNTIAGQVGVQGASGVVTALTQRVVLATDVALPTGTNSIGQVTANAGTNLNTSALALESGGNLAGAATSLAILDDWDESDRAKVNPIAGQAGVQGASGVVTALTQRVVLATDVALPAGTNNIGDVDVLTLPNVTNAGTFAVQESGAALTALQLLDDTVGTVAAAIPTKGLAALGTDGTNGRILKTDTGGELQVDVLSAVINTFPDNEPFNLAQANGVTVLMGNGVTGTGSLRVTPASDASANANWGHAAIGAAPPTGSVQIAGTTSGATAGLLAGITVCDSFANINQTTNTQIITGVASRRIYICSLNLVAAAAQNVAIVAGTGSVCGTTTVAVPGTSGGTTAATGWNLAANSGIVLGSGLGAIAKTTVNADNLCLLQSGSAQLSGGISYAIY